MAIQFKTESKSTYTRIYVLSSLEDTKPYCTSKELDHIKERAKKKELFEIIDTEKHLIFCFTENKTSEELRKLGHSIHAIIKNENEVSLELVNSNDLPLIEGLFLSNYQFLKYFKDKEERKHSLSSIYIKGVEENLLLEITNELTAVEWARDLVNEPVSFLDSVQIAKEIEINGVKTGFDVEIFEKNKIEALKMGGLLAVNKGSITPPTFTIMEWNPENAVNEKPLVLVGKGIVYDTGGLSLKPTAHSMDLMKSDMGGAACVAGAISAISANQLPVHVIGLIPATDNRPGGNAYAPGDVIEMFDGTTVEVLNTDAEGRMVLADALSYAKKYNPELVIDAATLTGAAVRAIGSRASINMGNADQTIFDMMEEAGNESGDRVVQFPFWDEYKDELKSDIADMKNLGGPTAGMITAGKFLEHFTDYPYIHTDIAGPAFLESPDSYKGKGGTGAGVRLIYNFIKKFATK